MIGCHQEKKYDIIFISCRLHVPLSLNIIPPISPELSIFVIYIKPLDKYRDASVKRQQHSRRRHMSPAACIKLVAISIQYKRTHTCSYVHNARVPAYVCVCICMCISFTLNHRIPWVAFWLMECAKAERICEAVNYHPLLSTRLKPFISYPIGRAYFLTERGING